MRNFGIFLIVILSMTLTSCRKENEVNMAKRAIKTLKVDEAARVFINDDGNHYVENTLVSQQDALVYELEMKKGTKYRISASQPNTNQNQTKLTLVNQVGDTLAESFNETISKSFIVVDPPETTNYYVIVELIKRTNPTFVFRLYFEELVDNLFAFADKSWESNGNWKIDNSNAAELTNYDSRILRHLKLIDLIPDHPKVSFVIQSTSNSEFDFGFILEGSDQFTHNSLYAYELTDKGYSFLTFNMMSQYSIMNLNPGSISYEWGSLNNVNRNFGTGVKIELIYEENQYFIYMNEILLTPVNGSLKNFIILIEDRGDGYTIIKDFQIVN